MRRHALVVVIASALAACSSTGVAPPTSPASESPPTTTETTRTTPPTSPSGTALSAPETTPPTPAETTTTESGPLPALTSISVVGQGEAWAETVEGAILYLSGESWADVSPPGAGPPTAASFAADHAWAASADGTVYRTADRGATWESSRLPLAETFVPTRMAFPDTVHGWILANGDGAAGTIYAQVFETTDGGATWTLVAGPPSTDETAALESGHNRDLAATADGRVWVTKDFGARLEPWIATSTDGGASWTERVVPIDSTEACATLTPHVDGVSFGAVLVHCGDSAWFAMSGDDGATWQTARLPDVAADMELFEDGAYAWGTRFMETIEPPGNWTIVATFPAPPSSVSIPDAVNGFAVIDGELWRTSDAGKTWERTDT